MWIGVEGGVNSLLFALCVILRPRDNEDGTTVIDREQRDGGWSDDEWDDDVVDFHALVAETRYNVFAALAELFTSPDNAGIMADEGGVVQILATMGVLNGKRRQNDSLTAVACKALLGIARCKEHQPEMVHHRYHECTSTLWLLG